MEHFLKEKKKQHLLKNVTCVRHPSSIKDNCKSTIVVVKSIDASSGSLYQYIGTCDSTWFCKLVTYQPFVSDSWSTFWGSQDLATKDLGSYTL